MKDEIGSKCWVIPEGYIPPYSRPKTSELISHEAACILNATDKDAQLEITIYFSDKEPIGPYKLVVPARRTLHMRFNDLKHPAPIPVDTDYASVIISDTPIVVQHTRLDSRDPSIALISTIAFPAS